MFKRKTTKKGFSVVEVMLAVFMFIIIAATGVATVIHSFSVNRQSEEETQATLIAQEGIEGVRSIKNQSWSNLSAGIYGLDTTGNVWSFDAGPDNVGKFSRSIQIFDVNRDVDGNIVDSGGTSDPDTKKIVSNVNWNFTDVRLNSISLTSYLTNFRKSIVTAGDAITIYGDGTNTPKSRTYTNASDGFGNESNTLAGSSGLTFVVRTSPTKLEATAGYVGSDGNLRILCFNGLTWSQEWTASVGGVATTRRFDIAYETNSGDVVVLYGTNAVGTNELAYRTKQGSLGCGSANWSSAINLDPQRTSGIIHWVKMAGDRRAPSNLVAAIWADSSSDLSTMIWSGSGFVNEPSNTSETSLEVILSAQDVDDFDVEYESTSGDVMVVWANSVGNNKTNGVRYRTCTNGTSTCVWNAVTTPPTFADDAHNLDISANPDNDQIIFASLGKAGDDLQVGRWDGGAWVNVANKDTSVDTSDAGGRNVATGWLIVGGTTRGIVIYANDGTTNINYLTMTPGATPTWSGTLTFNQTPPFNIQQVWYEIQMDPKNKDRLMFTVTDAGFDLFAKRLVMTSTPTFTWSNSDAGSALETSLGQATVSPFGFAYWRNP